MKNTDRQAKQPDLTILPADTSSELTEVPRAACHAFKSWYLINDGFSYKGPAEVQCAE